MFWASIWQGGNRRWMYLTLLYKTEPYAFDKWFQLSGGFVPQQRVGIVDYDSKF